MKEKMNPVWANSLKSLLEHFKSVTIAVVHWLKTNELLMQDSFSKQPRTEPTLVCSQSALSVISSKL